MTRCSLLRSASSKRGFVKHIGDQVECLWQLVVDDLYRKTRFLVRRKSVEIAAEPVLLDGDVESRAFAVPLKTVCSIKCEMPFSSAGSCREPTRKKNPSVAAHPASGR